MQQEKLIARRESLTIKELIELLEEHQEKELTICGLEGVLIYDTGSYITLERIDGEEYHI